MLDIDADCICNGLDNEYSSDILGGGGDKGEGVDGVCNGCDVDSDNILFEGGYILEYMLFFVSGFCNNCKK